MEMLAASGAIMTPPMRLPGHGKAVGTLVGRIAFLITISTSQIAAPIHTQRETLGRFLPKILWHTRLAAGQIPVDVHQALTGLVHLQLVAGATGPASLERDDHPLSTV